MNPAIPPAKAFNPLLALLAWLAVTFSAAAIGAVASINAREFYIQLARPDWAPPPWLFSPVWSVLYALMAIAAWLVWRRSGFAGARVALYLFLIQLVANALWSWLFFAWRQGGPAFGEVVILWCLIAATVSAFWQHHRVAALLLLPYLGWVGFASALTYSVWQLNPALQG